MKKASLIMDKDFHIGEVDKRINVHVDGCGHYSTRPCACQRRDGAVD